MFTQNKLEVIVKGFSKVIDQLDRLVEANNNAIGESVSQIASIEARMEALAEEKEKAQKISEKLRDLIN